MRRLCSLIAGLLCFSVFTALNATPVYYTFEGTVTNNVDCNSGALGYVGIQRRVTEITYTIMIDADVQGYEAWGAHYPGEGYMELGDYAEFYSGDRITNEDLEPYGLSLTHIGSHYLSHFAVQIHIYQGWNHFNITIGEPDQYRLNISSNGNYTNGLDGLYEGQGFEGWYTFGASYDGGVDTNEYYVTDLTLNSISNSPPPQPVPETATIVLFSIGFIGVYFLKRRHR